MSSHKIKQTLFFFNYSTENREKEDKPKEEETKEPVMEEKPKMRSSRQKEEATSFTSGVFALLDVYLTKMLVSHHVSWCNMLDACLIRNLTSWPRIWCRPV